MTVEEEQPATAEAPQGLEGWLRGVLAAIRGVEDPDEIKPDGDGDYMIESGSSATYVRILQEPQRIQIFAQLVDDLADHPDLYVHLNQINSNLELGSVHFSGGSVYLRHMMLAESLSFGDVRMTIEYFANMADTYDHKLQERFGGATAFRQDRGDEIDV